MIPAVSAVLFVRDVRCVTRFYVAVLEANVLAVDDRHAALDVRGFRLVMHEITPALPPLGEAPPTRRQEAAIRIDYRVEDVVSARSAASRHGGQIDELPPAWAPEATRFFLGHDPEGNVFGIHAGGS
jgi:predicted enzyme related to lactoylglutathione lyase